MDDASFRSILAVWQPHTQPRVWSILVTLFGDIAQTPASHLSGKAVTAILTELNIRPEAIRVALHRLRNDGWIQSTKVGRQSNYSLTKWGLAQCAAASPRIYGPWLEPTRVYLMANCPGDGMVTLPDGAIQIAPHLFIISSPVDDSTALVTPLYEDQPIPHWIHNKLFPEDLRAAALAFGKRVAVYESLDPNLVPASPTQIAALRITIVHEWRRIILRAPNVPDFLQPSTGLNWESRRALSQMLDKIHKPNLDVLNGHCQKNFA